jgi:spore germination protein KB
MELTTFLPVFEVPLTEFIQATHIVVTIPICEIFIFLLVFPSLNKKQQLNRSVLLGLIIGTGYLFLTVVRNVAVLGPLIGITSAPSYEAVRLIDIGHFLTRLEVLFAIVLIIMSFLKSSILYYVLVLGIAQLLRLRSYLPLVFPLGIIGISFSVLMYDSSIEQAFVGSTIWPIYALPFEFLLPLLSLVLAKLRRLPKFQGGSR